MEVKSLLRNNTMSLLNRKATLKALKPIKKNESEKEIKDIPKLAYESHHAFKFIRGTAPSAVDFKKFVTLLYRGLSYSVYNLKGPSEEFIKKKKVKLPELGKLIFKHRCQKENAHAGSRLNPYSLSVHR